MNVRPAARTFSQIALTARTQSFFSKVWQVIANGGNSPVAKAIPPSNSTLQQYKNLVTEVSPYGYILVDSVEKLTFASSYLQNERVISVDCEGTNLSRHGKVCLLQIATERETFLFDVLSLGSTTFEHGIENILQDHKIMKVMHDCRADSDALFHQFSVRLANVYDLQTVHALHQKVSESWTPKNRASLTDLVKAYAPQEANALAYKVKLRPQFKDNPTMWEQRPLSQLLINYACADVRMMFPVYHTLIAKVDMNRYSQYLNKTFKMQLEAYRECKKWPPPQQRTI